MMAVIIDLPICHRSSNLFASIVSTIFLYVIGYEEEKKKPVDYLLSFLDSAQNTVDICIYSLSAQEVIKKLIELHQRGIRIRVISNDISDKPDKLSYAYLMTNKNKNKEKSSMMTLQRKGINVRYFKTGKGYMHNKFAIIDDKILINGSFNWTYYGEKHNYEDMVATNDKQLAKCYADKFAEYWKLLEDPMVAWVPEQTRTRKKSY